MVSFLISGECQSPEVGLSGGRVFADTLRRSSGGCIVVIDEGADLASQNSMAAAFRVAVVASMDDRFFSVRLNRSAFAVGVWGSATQGRSAANMVYAPDSFQLVGEDRSDRY